MICKLSWKNGDKTSAVVSIKEIKPNEIPWDNKEILLGRYDPDKGLLIMKPEKDIKI